MQVPKKVKLILSTQVDGQQDSEPNKVGFTPKQLVVEFL
jgi:hypothetical protein